MFDLTIATKIVAQNEQFPVNFDELWQWCGYSRKDKAKNMLVKNFEESFDFEIHQPGELSPREVWNRLTESYPEVVTKCDNLKFQGKGQRLTPVANRENML